MRTPAEEARTLVALGRVAALATLSADGSPWCSHVAYGLGEHGTPELSLSTLAEHGRNARRDPRASLLVVEPGDAGDPLDRGRGTLAGRLAPPGHAPTPPFAAFTAYVLMVERVRWVGGYG